MSKALADCLRYNRWANLTLIDACRGLTEEQLDARAPGSSRSVRELFQHAAGSDLTFVLRTQGRQHEDEIVALPYQGKTYEYPKSFFLLHAIEHGVEHRTEIKVTLALIGIETPDLDGWFYAPAAGYGREV